MLLLYTYLQVKLLLALLGGPAVLVLSLYLSNLSSLAGPGSALLVFVHFFGKLVQLFGHEISGGFDTAEDTDGWTGPGSRGN